MSQASIEKRRKSKKRRTTHAFSDRSEQQSALLKKGALLEPGLLEAGLEPGMMPADYATMKWKNEFDCTHLRPLIICRGPVRKEAMDIFERMGIHYYGILLSEKDSVMQARALAPELRQVKDPERVHRVTDYSGVDKQERLKRIDEILRIAKENDYNAIFAGYGFMAEDEVMVSAVERAGLRFIGPCSRTVKSAGQKDEAKRIAESVGVTTIPGMDQLASATLLAEYPTFIDLKRVADINHLEVDFNHWMHEQNMHLIAHAVLESAMARGIDLFTIEALGAQAVKEISKIYREFPENRVRMKAVLGGGGKGQRIVASPAEFEGDLTQRIERATQEVPMLVQAILSAVKATGKGDNKNLLIELNIETTRHQEVQLVGNGDWAIALGARDCSLQMHEQKLVELSQTSEGLDNAIAELRRHGANDEANVESAIEALDADKAILTKMESEAVRFAQEVGLDSVSTFECIVDAHQHFFMEMNTRIQVEHRVTELCYDLQFTDPDNSSVYFTVESIVELMVLLACHKERLPKPVRVPKAVASVELRLNATDHALQPHPGGDISYWSEAGADELRDDQGISMRNPDTGQFITYTISGAYDSNIALLLTDASSKRASIEKIIEIVRRTRLCGHNLKTNLDFHYGVLNWLLYNSLYAKVTTAFIKPYLTLVGLVLQQVKKLDLNVLLPLLQKQYIAQGCDAAAAKAILGKKETLILRPLNRLMQRPHLLSAWLSCVKPAITFTDEGYEWRSNPVDLLLETYHLLNMDWQPELPSAYVIWAHDHQLLQEAKQFYEDLSSHLPESFSSLSYAELDAQLRTERKPSSLASVDDALWSSIRAAHKGHQLGLDLLALIPLIAKEIGFYDLKVDEQQRVCYPDPSKVDLQSNALHKAMLQCLEPLPDMTSDEILSVSGGMFYLQSGPDQPPFIEEGQHFKKGDPLYIIEVMKMFNTVEAPFSGRVDKILMDNHHGEIVKRGQPLFKVTPDQEAQTVDEDHRESGFEFSSRWVARLLS